MPRLRGTAPGFAALAIITGSMVMTWGHLPLAGDCARLRRACDHHWF
ncbi:DNA-formamidopyrimidine glycosylase, partial [Mycobacterium tuberculosis]